MPITVKIPGAGSVNLSQNNFIASGGEGAIYGIGDTIYKIYHDKNKMIPQGKFDDLSVLTERNIVNPQKILLDKKSIPVGFTMEWFKDNLPICKVFTTSFRKKSNFEPSHAVKLVENIQKSIDFVHSKECLIVDFNDINFLLDSKTLTNPIFIDVDSYKTKNFPPTAITPYAQDHHSDVFSTLTDWYGFAIIAFQIFIGMHPFKGTFDGFQKGSVVERMKANKSVFNKKAKIPKSARDFGHIPNDLRIWMEDVFEKGKRTSPPLVGGRIQVAKPIYTRVSGGNNFDIELVKSYEENISYHFSFMNEDIIRINNNLFVGKRQYSLTHKNSEIVVFPDTMVPVEVTKKYYRALDGKEVFKQSMNIDQITVSNNTILAKVGNRLMTMPVRKITKYVMSIDKNWSVMPLSTKLFSGMVYQDVIGKPYIIMHSVRNGVLVGESLYIPEMEGYKVITAKCVKNVAVIIAHKNKQYSRFILRYDNGRYDIQEKQNVVYAEPNFTVLDKGIVVLMNENSEIEIFKAEIGDKAVKVIDDNQLDNTCTISSNGSKVLFYRGKDIYTLRMVK